MYIPGEKHVWWFHELFQGRVDGESGRIAAEARIVHSSPINIIVIA